jgi:putative redox protein
MPQSYRIRLVANGDGTVAAENEHGASMVMGPSGPDRFSPVELLVVALGGCSGMDFVDLMAKQRRPVAPVELEVTAERAPGDAQRLAWLRVAYRPEVDERDATKVERARRTIPEKTCTVSRTLMHGCTVEHVVEPPRAVG